jgi:Rod binding domain-containing protein
MDLLESTGMLPESLGAVLPSRQPSSLARRLEGTTPEAVAAMEDLQKQELAKDFESLLLTRLLNEVKASVNASSFDEDAGSDQIHGMFWSFLAEDVSEKGGFGLWQEIYQNLKDMEGGDAAGELMDKEL